MLSGFTGNAEQLLLGVDIGGLGTLIASLASLISFKLYGATAGAKKGRYFAEFSAYNFAMLIVLFAAADRLQRPVRLNFPAPACICCTG